MRLPSFEYFEPGTVAEACALLRAPGARALAGGTELLVGLKQRTLSPSALVNLKRIPELNGIEQSGDGGLSIGAATPLRAVAASPLVKDGFGVLAHAAASVGKPLVPETATIGGNVCLDARCFYYNQSRLWKRSVAPCFKDDGEVCHVAKGSDHCHALFVADTVPALIALQAKVVVAGPGGSKKIHLEEFFTGEGERVNVLEPGQIVTRIEIPAPPSHSAGVHLKHSLREAIDFAIVGLSAVIVVDPEVRTCVEARIALGSVGTGPLRAIEAEAALRGRAVEEGAAAVAAGLAAREARPIGHLGFSAGYRRRMVEVMTRRAVMQTWQQAIVDLEPGEA
jgi:4-hydroxybenzoyl-CoA reductase beta subunit